MSGVTVIKKVVRLYQFVAHLLCKRLEWDNFLGSVNLFSCAVSVVRRAVIFRRSTFGFAFGLSVGLLV